MKSLLALALGVALLTGPLGRAAENQPASEKPAPQTVRNVGVEEFDKLRADKNSIVLDVRTAREFTAGHIPGAINIDYNAPDFSKKIAELDKSKTYLVHCAAGVRSAKACTAMDKVAFPHLVNLDPGFKAWEKAGKPVAKGEAKK